MAIHLVIRNQAASVSVETHSEEEVLSVSGPNVHDFSLIFTIFDFQQLYKNYSASSLILADVAVHLS